MSTSGNVTDDYRDYTLLSRRDSVQIGTIVGYGRLWFVKSLTPQCRDISECKLLLKKEYEILATLTHPSIVRVMGLHDIPQLGLSIVMEYVEGEHLDQFLQSANQHQRKIIARSLLDAAAYIHRHGVTHLDLKPENILVRGRFATSVGCTDRFQPRRWGCLHL